MTDNNIPWLVAEDGGASVTIGGRIEPHWVYGMRLAQQNGRWVVAAMTVIPAGADARHRLLIWSQSTNDQTVLAEGGLTARHLRRIPFRAHSGVTLLNDLPAKAAAIARAYTQPLGRGARKWVVIAARYVEALNRGSQNPNEDVANELDLDVVAVRDLVYWARRKGLLSTTRQRGVMGGKLTRLGAKMLREEQEADGLSNSESRQGRKRGAKPRKRNETRGGQGDAPSTPTLMTARSVRPPLRGSQDTRDKPGGPPD